MGRSPFPILPAEPASKPACCAGSKSGSAVSPETFFGRLPWWIWLAAASILLSLLIFSLEGAGFLRREIGSHLKFIGKASRSILPFFIASVALSAWVTVSGFSERIRSVFARRERSAIFVAALVGSVVPICSCGVIPLIAALLSGGVPLGPVMAFWLSSPLMSPEIFLLTAGMLGLPYAVGRLAAAIVIGAGAGYLIHFLSLHGLLNDQLHGTRLSAEGSGAGPHRSNPAPATWRSFGAKAWSVSIFLGKWLLLAFVLESLIVHYVDPAWISSLLGRDRIFSIPLATAVGIPLYTSGVAAIPIVKGLLESGMSPGAALAFLVAGPVTTIPAMAAVFALVKRRTFAIYLAAGIAGSLISGYLFQYAAG